MNPLIQLKKATPLFLVALLIAYLGWSQNAQAVSPAPDGGYPGANTAEGQNALFSLTSGGFNTAVGFLSLRSDTGGSYNTALGAGTLLANTADENTATGAGALLSNASGFGNTANGAFALFKNTSGGSNTADGLQALSSNLDGHDNTANGDYALVSNDHGNYNTAIGNAALFTNTSGIENTAVGRNALSGNNIGAFNTAIGDFALTSSTGDGNTAIGFGALEHLTTGNGNIALGDDAGFSVTTASGVICIGNSAGMDVSNTTWVRNIYQTTTVSGTTLPVIVSDGGQLGTTPSSRRFKKEIKPMDKTSETILALRPVTFHYKSDTKGTPQFGLVAEEVAAVNPDLVVRDKNGEIYTVRYDAVNAMLLNEFLKEHRKNEEQRATIAELKSTVAQQQKGFESQMAKQEKQIEALTSGLRKVSAQLEASKPAPQVVNNP